MSCTLSKKVLKNGETMGPVQKDGRDINFSNTSSYDSVTEILSHAIRRSQRVKNYFEGHRVAKCNQKGNYKSSYAVTVLNQAKHGSTSDSYEFRETFLCNTSNLARGRVSCFLHTPTDILTRVLGKYPYVGSILKLQCWSCTRENWSLHISMEEVRDGLLERVIRKFFTLESHICDECVRKSEPLVDTLPLLSISTEHYRLPFTPTYRKYDGKSESKASLDVLPVQLTIEGCVYVLCGVVGRVSKEGMSYHYVAFCRNVDGRWDNRDSLNEEIESLSELPVVHFSQIFYANLGYWDVTERKSLVDPAKSAWYRITEIRLPELCVHEIFGYLDNKQLKSLIEAAKRDSFKN